MKRKLKTATKSKLFQTALTAFILALIVLLIKQLPAVQQAGINNLGKENRAVKEREKIEISGVKVTNFLEPIISPSNSKEGLPSFVTINQTPDHHIFYIPADELFFISITSYPFDKHLPTAEKAMLQALAITEDEACNLNVDISTPSFANPDRAGEIYDLSFCSNNN